MSTPKDVLLALQAVLKADATLKAYVGDRVFLGQREGIPQQDFPIIMLEPATVTEQQLMNDAINPVMRVLLIAYTRVFDPVVQLTGDANYKGVLDLENDIKHALGAVYPTLSDTAIVFQFIRTEWAVSDHIEHPVRGVFMEIEATYRTTFSGRT